MTGSVDQLHVSLVVFTVLVKTSDMVHLTFGQVLWQLLCAKWTLKVLCHCQFIPDVVWQLLASRYKKCANRFVSKCWHLLAFVVELETSLALEMSPKAPKTSAIRGLRITMRDRLEEMVNAWMRSGIGCIALSS